MEKISLSVNRISHYISAFIMLALTFLTVFDVAGRYLFNSPIAGTYELTEFAMVIIVFLAFGYAEHFEDHVYIDIVYQKLPPFLQKILYMLQALLSLLVVVFMAWRLYLFAGRMQAGNYITPVLKLPIHPMVLLAALGTLVYAFAILTRMFGPGSNKGGDI